MEEIHSKLAYQALNYCCHRIDWRWRNLVSHMEPIRSSCNVWKMAKGITEQWNPIDSRQNPPNKIYSMHAKKIPWYEQKYPRGSLLNSQSQKEQKKREYLSCFSWTVPIKTPEGYSSFRFLKKPGIAVTRSVSLGLVKADVNTKFEKWQNKLQCNTFLSEYGAYFSKGR